jgi:hypothetical protein
MYRLHRFGVTIAVAGIVLSGAIGFSSIPAQARPDCSGNANLWHVHRRLDGAIDQLQHDRRDYGGHREQAIDDLQSARQQIVVAEQYAVNVNRENPACFSANGPSGGDANWGVRGQGGSNRDVWYVSRWVSTMIAQLQQDQHDYGGHRVAAIDAMQSARNQLQASEQYAGSHGY